MTEIFGIRAVIIAGNGSNFTLGGDVDLFTGTPWEQLPHRLRGMIDGYHQAIERLTSVDAPVVAVVARCHSGWRNVLYVADIVIAADDARFALGHGANRADVGRWQQLVSAAGGWNAARASAVSFESAPNRAGGFARSDLASRPQDTVEGAKFAAGPTRAFGAMRPMLRRLFETGFGDHLRAEKAFASAVRMTLTRASWPLPPSDVHSSAENGSGWESSAIASWSVTSFAANPRSWC